MAHQACTMAAVSNAWYLKLVVPFLTVIINDTELHLKNRTTYNDRNWDTYYMNLLKYCHGTKTASSLKVKTIDQLNSAPCNGPYRFFDNNPGNGWASSLKWRSDFNEVNGIPHTTVQIKKLLPIITFRDPTSGYCMYNNGYFPGMDFTSLYNLYHKNENLGFYSNLIYRTIDYPFGVNNKTTGAYERLTINKKLKSNQKIEIRSGNEIVFKDGFYNDSGSEFRAYISPYKCNDKFE